MSILIKSKKRCKNKEVPLCPYCGKELIRIYGDNGEIRCNSCNELLTRKVSSDKRDGTYVKCPYCGYEGEELIDADYDTKCPRCGRYVLRTHCNI